MRKRFGTTRRSRVQPRYLLLLAAWAFAGAGAVRAENGAAVNLDEIKRRLTEWRASFVNLRVVWEVRSLPQTDAGVDEWPPPPDPEAGRLSSRWEWIWADHGLDFLEDRTFRDGSSKGRLIDAFNGPKGVVFRARYQNPTDGGSEKLQDLQLWGLGVGKPISAITREATEWQYWSGSAEWLPEILSKWKWELETFEDVAGQPCARIAAVRDGWTKVGLADVLWLDLEHDCLVRRHRYRKLSGVWDTESDFIVDEFQRLEGGT